jgi:hypothetical protein
MYHAKIEREKRRNYASVGMADLEDEISAKKSSSLPAFVMGS